MSNHSTLDSAFGPFWPLILHDFDIYQWDIHCIQHIYIYTFRLSVPSESRRRPEAFAIAEAVSADVDHLRLKVPHDWP